MHVNRKHLWVLPVACGVAYFLIAHWRDPYGLLFKRPLTGSLFVGAISKSEGAFIGTYLGSSPRSPIYFAIPPAVQSFGAAPGFVAATRTPSHPASTEKVLQFYLYDLKANHVMGPLTGAQYQELEQRLGVPSGLPTRLPTAPLFDP